VHRLPCGWAILKLSRERGRYNSEKNTHELFNWGFGINICDHYNIYPEKAEGLKTG
jgi:hypothetical protein